MDQVVTKNSNPNLIIIPLKKTTPNEIVKSPRITPDTPPSEEPNVILKDKIIKRLNNILLSGET